MVINSNNQSLVVPLINHPCQMDPLRAGAERTGTGIIRTIREAATIILIIIAILVNDCGHCCWTKHLSIHSVRVLLMMKKKLKKQVFCK